ncbi:MAG: hypothetical protein ACD_49C00076G0003 [uncultured bacterium (gcode 4)]|uniref:Uncharacterized protein n=1 Tax=uncultured bacterium (gcode 4) TaxID=1234023 RepID=K2AVJ2_9BACT|nr:MAG: hypothetical protein ACD_49C00076G0003 [uncultured bacterium (gcode 4)]
MKKLLLIIATWISCILSTNISLAYTNAEIKAAVDVMVAKWATAQDIAAAANAYWVPASQMDSALSLPAWTATSYMAPPNKPAPVYSPPYFEPPMPPTPPPAPVTQVITSLNWASITVAEWADWMKAQAAAWKTNEEIAQMAVAAWFTLDQITKVANTIPWVTINTTYVQNLIKQDVAVNSRWTVITVQQWADWIKTQLANWLSPEMIASSAAAWWFDAETIAAATKLMAQQNPQYSSLVNSINADAITNLISSTRYYEWWMWTISTNWTVKDAKGVVIWSLNTSNWVFTAVNWDNTDVFKTSNITMNFNLPGWSTFRIVTDSVHNYEMAVSWANLALTASKYWVTSPETQVAYDSYNNLIWQMQWWAWAYNPSVNYAGAQQLSDWSWIYGCTNNPGFMWLMPTPRSGIITYNNTSSLDSTSTGAVNNTNIAKTGTTVINTTTSNNISQANNLTANTNNPAQPNTPPTVRYYCSNVSTNWNVGYFDKNIKNELYLSVRKNTYELIKWVSSTDNSIKTISNLSNFANIPATKLNNNSVIYYDLSNESNKLITIDSANSKLSWVKTIIIKWGNIYVKWNINYENSSSILGIIALKDDKNIWWDIYINKSISKVDANIFVDKWVSTYTWNNSYTLSDTSAEKLTIFWSVISNNTIWGSVTWKCPSFLSSCNIENAMRYDLKCIRKTWISSTNLLTQQQADQFAATNLEIKFNPLIEVTPPYGFR